MKIAVTAPTGHVGSAVANFLLEAGGIGVKLLGRRPEKLKNFVRRGAEVVVGSQDDADYLTDATGDVDALFWVTPPGYGSDDLRAYQKRMGRAAATAVCVNRIERVVNLSSLGANLESGVGPISGLHDVEELLDESSPNIVHLRPGFFFENLLWQMDTIKRWGRISLPLSGTTRYPMIACRDVAHSAYDWLKEDDWTGRNIHELHGSGDLCFDEVAKILSEILGRKIVYIRCDFEEARRSIIESGVSENAADAMLEMYDAVERRKVLPTQPRSFRTTTMTTLADFAREVMLPLIAQPVTH